MKLITTEKVIMFGFLVNATNDAVEEFNRVVRINEQVNRFIVVKEGE